MWRDLGTSRRGRWNAAGLRRSARGRRDRPLQQQAVLHGPWKEDSAVPRAAANRSCPGGGKAKAAGIRVVAIDSWCKLTTEALRRICRAFEDESIHVERVTVPVGNPSARSELHCGDE